MTYLPLAVSHSPKELLQKRYFEKISNLAGYISETGVNINSLNVGANYIY
jgi:hypothetical protein